MSATIKIEVEGKEMKLVGESFQEMLTEVRAVPGRRWIGDRSLWELPLSLEEAREILAPLEILGDGPLTNQEIQEITKIQKWILEDEPKILDEIKELEEKLSRYGYQSKSRIKASLSRLLYCLRCALKSAAMPVEELSEVRIREMKKACKIMGWEP